MLAKIGQRIESDTLKTSYTNFCIIDGLILSFSFESTKFSKDVTVSNYYNESISNVVKFINKITPKKYRIWYDKKILLKKQGECGRLNTHQLCTAQVNPLDSCGVDSNPVLNHYEITILDSLFFRSYQTKKDGKDPRNGFDFKGKKIAFYSCTKNSNTKGNGLLSKMEFFKLCRPDFRGHAGRGIITFTENEKTASKGFDAVIVIDCPLINKRNLITQLIKIVD